MLKVYRVRGVSSIGAWLSLEEYVFAPDEKSSLLILSRKHFKEIEAQLKKLKLTHKKLFMLKVYKVRGVSNIGAWLSLIEYVFAPDEKITLRGADAKASVSSLDIPKGQTILEEAKN